MTRPAFKSTLEKTYESCRQGNHATIYEVRRDPKLKDKNIIRDRRKQEFPVIGGAVYRGEWDEDQKSGFGTQTNPDGSKYEGEFRRNQYHGSGSMWVRRGKKNVKQYTGSWENGQMCGFGSFFLENGDIYKGEWAANQRSGEGRLDYPNGDYFIGEWMGGVQRGYGTMYLQNGNVFEGLYRDGLKDGPGRFFYSATRKVYEGEWVDGAPTCGEYREPTVEEEARFREPTIACEIFELPVLGLLDPQSIVDVAKSETRINNAGKRGLEMGHKGKNDSIAPETPTISKECMNRAAVVFAQLDEGDGLVPLSALSPVFTELGSDFTDDNIDAIRQELEIELDTALSFPEAIDIALYLLCNVDQDYEYER